MFLVWHGLFQRGASALGWKFSLMIRWKYNLKVMKMDDEAIAKELRLEVMMKTKYDDGREGTKTT
jgi:hypothetical protein